MLGRSLVLPVLLFRSHCHKTKEGRAETVSTDMTNSLLTWLIPPTNNRPARCHPEDRSSEVSSLTLGMRNKHLLLSVSADNKSLSVRLGPASTPAHLWSLPCKANRRRMPVGKTAHGSLTPLSTENIWKSLSKVVPTFETHTEDRGQLLLTLEISIAKDGIMSFNLPKETRSHNTLGFGEYLKKILSFGFFAWQV